MGEKLGRNVINITTRNHTLNGSKTHGETARNESANFWRANKFLVFAVKQVVDV